MTKKFLSLAIIGSPAGDRPTVPVQDFDDVWRTRYEHREQALPPPETEEGLRAASRERGDVSEEPKNEVGGTEREARVGVASVCRTPGRRDISPVSPSQDSVGDTQDIPPPQREACRGPLWGLSLANKGYLPTAGRVFPFGPKTVS